MCLSVEVRCAGSLEATGGAAAQSMECNDCEATWVDVYHLAAYDFLQLRDGTYIPIPQEPTP